MGTQYLIMDEEHTAPVTVLGAGSWGTAISQLLAVSGRRVTLWGRDESLAAAINSGRKNPRYLRDLRLDPKVEATAELAAAVTDAKVIVAALPSQAMRAVMERAAVFAPSDAIVVSLTKGLELDTLLRMSEVIRQTLGDAARVAVLSGPNHAEEVSLGIPSATVVAAEDPAVAAVLQRLFMTPSFRVYTNRDIRGVELAAATKNIIAIAAGISDGLGYGDNAKASLMTRGLAEMTRLGVALGANPLTFSGLAGVGDLIATCTSRHSRNRAVGQRLAEGRKAEQAQKEMGMVAEGVATVGAVCALARKMNLELPISQSVYEVIYGDKDPRQCVQELMSRGAAHEEL
jgi:glycerol-3-phosphate dehydrogenase (NAD(P)+)